MCMTFMSLHAMGAAFTAGKHTCLFPFERSRLVLLLTLAPPDESLRQCAVLRMCVQR